MTARRGSSRFGTSASGSTQEVALGRAREPLNTPVHHLTIRDYLGHMSTKGWGRSLRNGPRGISDMAQLLNSAQPRASKLNSRR